MPVKNSDENDMVVNSKEMALILGVSSSRVRQLTGEKALVRASYGKYDLPASIEAYINYRLNKEKPDGELDKTTEEALWTRARRKKTELELQIMRGELHRSEDVERVMNDMLAAFRAKILSIPSKFAPQVVGKTEIPPIKEVLKKGVHEALEELTDYDPTVFYDISKDKMHLEDDEEAAAREENELSKKEPVKRGRKKKD